MYHRPQAGCARCRSPKYLAQPKPQGESGRRPPPQGSIEPPLRLHPLRPETGGRRIPIRALPQSHRGRGGRSDAPPRAKYGDKARRPSSIGPPWFAPVPARLSAAPAALRSSRRLCPGQLRHEHPGGVRTARSRGSQAPRLLRWPAQRQVPHRPGHRSGCVIASPLHATRYPKTRARREGTTNDWDWPSDRR